MSKLQLSIGDEELKKLNNAFEYGVSYELRSMLNSLSPSDIAHLLESSPPKVRSLIWKLVKKDDEGDILQELNDEVRQFFLDQMNIAELKAITENQDVDDIADLLQQLPDKITQNILDLMDSQARQRVEKVLSYPENTAGGLMNTDFITVRQNITVDVVLRYLRRHSEIPEMTDNLMVVNRNDEYIGTLPLSKLLTTDPSEAIKNIMNKDIPAMSAETEAIDIAQIFERKNLISAPVVDESGKLLGRITIDDVVDVIREEAEHSIKSLAGLDDEDTFAPALKTARSRAIWLGINLITALIAASVIDVFQATIDKVVALAVLMPIVAGMGGNAGGQALTLVIRGMALGHISKNNIKWLLGRELASGFINSVLWASLVSFIAYLWFHDPIISIVIACAMVINLTVAVIVGASLPVVLKTMNIDPALAGTIILTTISDVLGFLSFLGLATIFYS